MDDPSTPAAGPDAPEQRTLSENCVEYYIFVVDSKIEARNRLARLESIRQAALQLSQTLTKDYIWQREEFNLELRNDQGLTYLYGITDYGDAVEDEWLIVHILRELTKATPSVRARVADSDGEFLLVEAANVLPKWINPEIDSNRVWIHNAQLFIIPVDEAAAPKTEPLTLSKAVDFLAHKSKALVHSPFIEEEAFYRLGKYPGQIKDSIHHSLVTIPRRLAHVVHALPRAIAPAVEAFYLRDAITLKPVLATSGPLTFPPEDLVTVSVRFSKVLFAQLRSQRFEAPPRWDTHLKQAESSETGATQPDVAHARMETGMKVACGFEMLAAKAEKSKSRVVRELAIVLEDLKEDGDETLPSDDEIKAWEDSQRNDDEGWMDINYEDFERELGGQRTASTNGKENAGFGDANTQADLRKIVSRFEAFLNDDDAGLDGAELDDMDVDDDDDDLDDESESEDREVSFDEAEFSKMMREMMGFKPVDAAEASPSTSTRQAEAKVTEVSDDDDDDDAEDIRQLTSQLESELKEHGALKLDTPSAGGRALKGKSKASEADASGTQEDDDSEEDVDIDYNLAKNLLESFKSQGGMSGPTGNLLGMMGFQLPRDEDDGNDGDGAAGSSSKPS